MLGSEFPDRPDLIQIGEGISVLDRDLHGALAAGELHTADRNPNRGMNELCVPPQALFPAPYVEKTPRPVTANRTVHKYRSFPNTVGYWRS